jgi:hypothetical protein
MIFIIEHDKRLYLSHEFTLGFPWQAWMAGLIDSVLVGWLHVPAEDDVVYVDRDQVRLRGAAGFVVHPNLDPVAPKCVNIDVILWRLEIETYRSTKQSS